MLLNFYALPLGADKWEDDIFVCNTLGAGESMQITIADDRSVYEYDMHFEFEESSDLDTTEDKQNLCKLGEYTIHK